MNNIIASILTVVAVLLGSYVSRFLLVLSNSIRMQTGVQNDANMMQLITSVISQCVVATNQQFVDSLKKAGEFTVEAQNEAFESTKNAVLDLLSPDAIEYIETEYNDVDLFLDKKIEEEVYKNKAQ